MDWNTVRQLILEDISKAGPGAELHSDANFARRTGVSVPTVKRAMADLARRGLVVRRRGRRTISSTGTEVVSGSDFSFSRAAREVHGQNLITQLIEKSCRLPHRSQGTEFELRAHDALGLKRSQPFLVIARLRLLDGSPRVIHRSFLNPAHYSATFLASHDFASDSLLEILETCGLRVHSRETKIRAGLPTMHEREFLKIEEEPVLNVEQNLYAVFAATGQLVTAEYLHATYARWEYIVSDRR